MHRPTNKINWPRFITRIRNGKFVPIISNRIFFPNDDDLSLLWASQIDYPYPKVDLLNRATISQYYSVTQRDEMASKEDFLEFAKEQLIKTVRTQKNGLHNTFLDEVDAERINISLSEIAAKLKYPHYDNDEENPLLVLASLPLPIYITTSYFSLMEKALIDVGKRPRTEICYWKSEFNDIDSIFKTEPDFQPSEEEPLVYHFHGIDTHPNSLVLTEDDYLDFLIQISRFENDIPARIQQAFVDSSLLLLGYHLDDWDFKVLYRGVINAKRASKRGLSLAIQLSPDDAKYGQNGDMIQGYLSDYFVKDNFDVYWGDTQTFTQELHKKWAG